MLIAHSTCLCCKTLPARSRILVPLAGLLGCLRADGGLSPEACTAKKNIKT